MSREHPVMQETTEVKQVVLYCAQGHSTLMLHTFFVTYRRRGFEEVLESVPRPAGTDHQMLKLTYNQAQTNKKRELLLSVSERRVPKNRTLQRNAQSWANYIPVYVFFILDPRSARNPTYYFLNRVHNKHLHFLRVRYSKCQSHRQGKISRCRSPRWVLSLHDQWPSSQLGFLEPVLACQHLNKRR